MGSVRITKRLSLFAMAFILAASLMLLMSTVQNVFASDASQGVDEIHAQFGNDASSQVWVLWRGNESSFYYGTTTTYEKTPTPLTAADSTVTPMDISGPFKRILLTGLNGFTEYHYKIGANGDDHTFKTAPGQNDTFTWADVGDTGTTYQSTAAASKCRAGWMGSVWDQLAVEKPDFFIHGGDITYANDCGPAAIHQFYEDIAPLAESRVFEQVWGNHEYGAIDVADPEVLNLWRVLDPNFPADGNDTYLNYKGRNVIPNAQTLTSDTATTTKAPGCGVDGTNVNTCRGNDYGWFKAGGVLFLMLPENHTNAYGDATLSSGWAQFADGVMSAAQLDDSVDMVVTVSHQPSYTSLLLTSGEYSYNSKVRTVIDALGDKYSPSAISGGKYVLNVNHHIHGSEVVAPQHGVWHVTSGGGGIEQTNYSAAPISGSVMREESPAHLVVKKQGKVLSIKFICGPPYSGSSNCTQGETVQGFQQDIAVEPYNPPAPQTLCSSFPGTAGTEYVTNRSIESLVDGITGWTDKYSTATQQTIDTQQACDGFRSVKISVKSGTSPTSIGFLSNTTPGGDPQWVAAGTATQTTAGNRYTGSVYVKPFEAGKKLTLMIQEKNPAGGNVNDAKIDLTPTNTLWQSMQTPEYIAQGTGNSIVFKLYESVAAPATLPSTAGFYADQMSLVMKSGTIIPPQTVCSNSFSNELVTNRSIETSLDGWSGALNDKSVVQRDSSDACDGSYSVFVHNSASTRTDDSQAGFTNSPQYVDGVNNATAINTVYTGAVWVKGTAGSTATLQLQEKKMDVAGTVVNTDPNDGTNSITLNGSWQKLTADHAAIQTGNKLGFRVYTTSASGGPATLDFHADNMSLTTSTGTGLTSPAATCRLAPADFESLSNPSFEESLRTWSLKNKGATSVIRDNTSGNVCDGFGSMRVKYNGTGTSYGVYSSDTASISNTANNESVKVSVALKAGAAGQVIRIGLAEYQNATNKATSSLVSSDQKIWPAPDTAWHRVNFTFAVTQKPRSYVRTSMYVNEADQANGNIPNNSKFWVDAVSLASDKTPSIADESDKCSTTYPNEKITNTSVEGGWGAWNTKFNSTSVILWDTSVFGAACDGYKSVKTTASTGGTAQAGFQSNTPYYGDADGGTYIARVWAKTSYGESVRITLLEKDNAGNTVKTANSTTPSANQNWHEVSSAPFTIAAGNKIQIKVSMPSPGTQDWMYVDKFSLSRQ